MQQLPFNNPDNDANEQLKQSARFSLQCIRCEEHIFHLLPTGHAKCAMCGLIYSYVYATKEWVFTSSDVFEEKAAQGEVFSDKQFKFIPLLEKLQEKLGKNKKKKKRKPDGENPETMV